MKWLQTSELCITISIAFVYTEAIPLCWLGLSDMWPGISCLVIALSALMYVAAVTDNVIHLISKIGFWEPLNNQTAVCPPESRHLTVHLVSLWCDDGYTCIWVCLDFEGALDNSFQGQPLVRWTPHLVSCYVTWHFLPCNSLVWTLVSIVLMSGNYW